MEGEPRETITLHYNPVITAHYIEGEPRETITLHYNTTTALLYPHTT